MSKTAIVLGASGLVGTDLVKQLIDDPDFSSVKLFLRKKMDWNDPKIEQHTVDFEKLGSYQELIKADVVFCCLGTTIKTAGSKDAFIKVDHTYPIEFAQIAKRNGTNCFVLISSMGADSNSSNFYLKVKGNVESDLKRMRFKQLVIVRPSMLLGNRKEFRMGELIGKKVMQGLSFLFVGKLKRYKAIQSVVVAKAMRLLSKNDLPEISVFENDRLLEIGK